MCVVFCYDHLLFFLKWCNTQLFDFTHHLIIFYFNLYFQCLCVKLHLTCVYFSVGMSVYCIHIFVLSEVNVLKTLLRSRLSSIQVNLLLLVLCVLYGLMCVRVHIHTPCTHTHTRSVKERGVYPSFPSPSFGDNDDHFFFFSDWWQAELTTNGVPVVERATYVIFPDKAQGKTSFFWHLTMQIHSCYIIPHLHPSLTPHLLICLHPTNPTHRFPSELASGCRQQKQIKWHE